MPVKARSVLVIDDDRDDRNLFIEALIEIDDTLNCSSAENGEEALGILNDTTLTLPDFIILDLRMPRYGGKKCLQEIKKSQRLKDIPVFIYTTSKNVEESNELSKIGACHFMTKPGNVDEIYFLASFILNEQWVDTPLP